MTIDSSTILGSLFLFLVTTMFISFVLAKINPSSLQNKDTKKVILWKAIGMGILISGLFTFVITYLSIKVDKQDLKNAKKSSQ